MQTTIGRARELAAVTPAHRNRTIDFLRAVAIAAVVLGHWLVAAVWFDADGALNPRNLLAIEPWVRWATWVFQVMPLFFVVGGYANAASWGAAERKGVAYSTWLANRYQRLLGPVVPLVLVWVAIAGGALLAGVDTSIISIGSQAALVPVWFLAVYVAIVAVAPLAYRWWQRAGWRVFVAVAATAVLADALRLLAGWEWAGWTNYAWVWLAAHLLGFAWHDGRLPSAGVLISVSFGALVVMTRLLGYSSAMVGVPGQEFGNTFPPTVALLALGVGHVGIARLAEPALERWLRRPGPWTATIAINGSIMSLYIWHLTVMVLVIGASALLGGFAMHTPATTAAWWWQRPLWVALLIALMVPVLAIVGRFERSPQPPARRSLAALVIGGAIACVGLSLLALQSVVVGGSINWPALALPLAGAWIAGVSISSLGTSPARMSTAE